MISIHPEWCEKILSGEKTIEIRKTRPKLPTPFKCYIYCTSGNKESLLNGKAIAEFTCDRIGEFYKPQSAGAYAYYKLSEKSCVSVEQIAKYANGKNVFGWHISNVKFYDDGPLPLGCFFVEANKTYNCPPLVRMKYPPQSWCYVEELENEE